MFFQPQEHSQENWDARSAEDHHQFRWQTGVWLLELDGIMMAKDRERERERERDEARDREMKRERVYVLC